MKKTTDQAYEILEDAAINTNQWPREKATPVKAVGGTDNEVLNNLVNHVAQVTKQLTRQQGTANAIQTNPWELCEFCGGQHNSTKCQSGNQTVEQAQYLSRFNQSQSQQQGQYGGNNYQNQHQGQGGVIIKLRTVRTIKGMDGGTIRTIFHQTELLNHLLRKRWT